MDSTTSLSVATQAPPTQVAQQPDPPPPPAKADSDAPPVKPAGPKDNGKDIDVQA
ncbi:hypothetical protein [Roseiterribacter gracilis]